MVRRTRKSISKYYAKDLKNNDMEFPNVKNQKPVNYEFDELIKKYLMKHYIN